MLNQLIQHIFKESIIIYCATCKKDNENQKRIKVLLTS